MRGGEKVSGQRGRIGSRVLFVSGNKQIFRDKNEIVR